MHQVISLEITDDKIKIHSFFQEICYLLKVGYCGSCLTSLPISKCAPPSLSAGRVEPPTKFSEGGLDRTSAFRGGDFFQGGCNFHTKNKSKLIQLLLKDKIVLRMKIIFWEFTERSNFQWGRGSQKTNIEGGLPKKGGLNSLPI